MKKFPAILAFAFAALTLVGEAFDFDAKFKQAQNGDATAQNEIGEYYADGGRGKFPPDYSKAIAWWQLAANNGNPRGLTNIGASYYSGKGVPRNSYKAVECWLEAAKRGDAEAQYLMGQAYSGGVSVLPDVNTAVFWWDKAAQQKHPKAQFNLAFAYAKGFRTLESRRRTGTFAVAGLPCALLFHGRRRQARPSKGGRNLDERRRVRQPRCP